MSLAYVTTNRAGAAFDAEAQRQEREARQRQERDVDAAIRGGLAGVVAGATPRAPAPAPGGGGAAPRVQTASATVQDPDDDDDAAVRTILGEAAGEGSQGMAGVAHVIRNRATQSGMTPRQVVLAPSQFEPWQTRRAELMAIDRNSPQYQEALRIWRAANAGEIPDPTGGADHFFSPRGQAAAGRAAPSWAQGTPTVIGGHNFYRLGYRGTPGAPQPAAAPAATPASAPAQPPGNPLAPAILALSRTPGGGQAALRLLQAGQQMATQQENQQFRRDQLAARYSQDRQQNQIASRERMQAERNMMIALGRGDTELARTFAERAGITLPEQAWQDRQAHGRFAAATLLARRYYGTGPQAQAFVTEYMRDGNAMRAAEAAGAPRGREQGWRPMWVQEGEREVLRLLNPNTGEMRLPQGPDGAPAAEVQRPPRGAAGGRQGATAERRATLMRIYNDEALVDRLMSGVAPNPRQIAQAYQGFVRIHGNNPSMMNDAAAQQRAAEADMDAAFPGWRRIRDGAGTTAPPAPTEPPAPAPAPAAPAAPPAGGLPRVTTRAEWEALPPGARYIDPQGNTRTKAPRA